MLHFTKSPELVLVHIHRYCRRWSWRSASRSISDKFAAAVGSSLATRRVPSQTSTAA